MQTKLKALEGNTVKAVKADARNMLGTTLADVAEGKLDATNELLPWHGFLNALDYAQNICVLHCQHTQCLLMTARSAPWSTREYATTATPSSRSTLVHALLHQDVLLINQQPLMLMFCKVRNALENDGVKEAHNVKLGKVAWYNCTNLATSTRAWIDNIETLQGGLDAVHSTSNAHVATPALAVHQTQHIRIWLTLAR
ncbi:hypothetical protein FRC07_000164 [Ceratobasidium sp. 392]|nr:hypothetical protein FRC07_000164 [Ceratobasidium sp. 392]